MISRRSLLQAMLASPALAGCAAIARSTPHQEIRVAAPFAMPAIRVPDFSQARRFPITDFGAVEGDKARTSAAIAQAIAAAHAAGQGRVVVPRGTWLTRAVHLRSNVNLHLEEGATLLFSEDPQDYLPPVLTSWEGIECVNYSPLLYAYDCENIAVTGKGTLQARLDTWRVWYKRPKPHMDALVALYQQAVKNVPVAQRRMTKARPTCARTSCSSTAAATSCSRTSRSATARSGPCIPTCAATS